jgi:anhydro-N-acetylmuramic acid kinase
MTQTFRHSCFFFKFDSSFVLRHSSFPMLILGLMSGTSVDAIDAALVRIARKADRYTARVIAHHEHAWPRKLRTRLLAAMAPAQTTTQELCELHTLVAHEFAAAVEELLAATATPREKITALASHGQTVCHLPPPPATPLPRRRKLIIENPILKIGSTLQLGDPSTLATLTRIVTVANFRPADIALGGQGAPLVPFADDMLLAHPTKSRAIQNIGGIANVTFLPALTAREASTWTFYTPYSRSEKTFHLRPPVRAFDTGPGNMLIDALISLATDGRHRFDKNARLARQGALDLPLFRHLQHHPYFTRRPPKSTGREDFGVPFAQKLLAGFPQLGTHDSGLRTFLHTATRLTAWSIADAYLHFLPQLPDEVILCGGGADNPLLVEMLAEELASLSSEQANIAAPKIRRIDDLGIPNKSKEAASFALLAAATLDGRPGNLPSVTGARRPAILGVVARP